MENLYFFVTSLSSFDDPSRFLSFYFIESGGFVTCFLIALIVAIVGLLLFYGWIGMVSPRLSKLSTWLVTFVCVGLITMAATQLVVIGSNNNGTGFFENAQQRRSELREGAVRNGQDEIDKLDSNYNKICDEMDKGCDVVYVLDTWNMGISLIIFFVGSLGVKRLTRYAIAVPF